MQKIHISELYSTSNVTLGSELYYICELGKYFTQCGYQLSINGIVLDPVLKKSRFWNYLKIANYNGWVTDIDCLVSEMDISELKAFQLKTVENRIFTETPVARTEDEIAKRRDDEFYDMITPTAYQVVFGAISDDTLVWTKGTKQHDTLLHAQAFGGNYGSQCFVSLIAYVAVKRFLTHEFNKFNLVFDEIYLSLQHSVSDVILLEERTNAFDWLDIKYNTSSERLINLGYEAWLYRGREMGFEYREYSPKEKLNNAKRLGFAEGDVIGLYTRKTSQRGNLVKSLTDFNFAIIRKISSASIKLEVVLSRKTKYGYFKDFEELSPEVKAMYLGRDASDKEFRSKMVEIAWNDLGVEYMMSDEGEFIVSLQGDDFADLVISVNDEERLLSLCEFDYIYWILKDYSVDFAEEKFLKKYFPTSEPAYFKVMGGSKDNI